MAETGSAPLLLHLHVVGSAKHPGEGTEDVGGGLRGEGLRRLYVSEQVADETENEHAEC